MALTRNDRLELSWDDLLAAINPQPPSPETLYRQALAEVVVQWQSGAITEKQADELVAVLISANISRQVGEMVHDYFSSDGFAGQHEFSFI